MKTSIAKNEYLAQSTGCNAFVAWPVTCRTRMSLPAVDRIQPPAGYWSINLK